MTVLTVIPSAVEGSALTITSSIEIRVSIIEYFQSKTLIPQNKN